MGLHFTVAMARCLYSVHLVAIVIWLALGMCEILRQRRRIPSEWEYFGVRFFVLYVIFEALRSYDLCFDSEDGVCRAVWGVFPAGYRMLAWWGRDAVLLAAVSFYLDFTLGWTTLASGRPARSGLRATLWIFTGAAILSLAGCFLALLFTNRQSWQVWSALGLIVLNIAWSCANAHILKHVLPEVRLEVNGFADHSTSSKPEVRNAESVYLKAKMSAWTILVVNVGILLLFPFMVWQRLQHANGREFIPSVALDNWAGSVPSPILDLTPPGIALNPAPEFLEFCIGWGQFGQLILNYLTDEDFRSLLSDEASSGNYVSRSALGQCFRKIARKED